VCLFAAVVTGTRLGEALSPVVVIVVSPALITLNAAAMVTIRLHGTPVSRFLAILAQATNLMLIILCTAL